MANTLDWLYDTTYYVAEKAIQSPGMLLDMFLKRKPEISIEPPAKEVVYHTVETISPIVAESIMIPSYTRIFVRIAGMSGALAVALGAYGAHAFYQRDVPEELKQVYETANRYHFLHTLALLGVPLCKRPQIAGTLIALGTLIFSGTCYYYALTGSRNVRQYTPYGGMMLIFGWLAMVL